MTAMIRQGYRMADAIRAVGVPVVMGGPHVTEEADEALGRNGGPRHADAVALGEADETWPKTSRMPYAASSRIFIHGDDFAKSANPVSGISGDSVDKINLDQFNLVPKMVKRTLQRVSDGWGTFRIIPMESGRGCPYGCEFCTVNGFFGDSIRFRTNESVVNELLLLKARPKARAARLPSSSSTIISPSTSNVPNPCCATLSPPAPRCTGSRRSAPNLLRDEELVDHRRLRREVGLHRHGVIDPTNLADVNKGFNKPGEYAAVLQRLAQRNVYAITSSFSDGQRHRRDVAERTLKEIRTCRGAAHLWLAHSFCPRRALQEVGGAGRLTRPKHCRSSSV